MAKTRSKKDRILALAAGGYNAEQIAMYCGSKIKYVRTVMGAGRPKKTVVAPPPARDWDTAMARAGFERGDKAFKNVNFQRGR